jgi:hypothetical protein
MDFLQTLSGKKSNPSEGVKNGLSQRASGDIGTVSERYLFTDNY